MNRKIFCIILFLSAACTNIYSQCYFCDREGATLEYVRKKVADGSFVWRFKGTVIGVTETDTYRECTVESSFTKQNGKPYYRSSIIQTVSIDKQSDDVSLDLGGAMASFIKARAGLSSTCSKVVSTLPASAQPGDALEPVEAQAKVGPLTYNLKITDRKILRRETISVPAGTFDCIVVEEHRVESGPGHNRDVINHTWYCKGVGYVRHDTFIKGKLDTSEVLYSIF